MTVPRKRLSERAQLDKFIEQDGICFLCKAKMLAGQPRTLEHIPCRQTLIDNGETDPDQAKYQFWVHSICAGKKTRGKEGDSDKHSVADGDTSKIAKGARLAVKRLPKAEIETPVGRDPGWRLKKKMDGTTVRVRTR